MSAIRDTGERYVYTSATRNFIVTECMIETSSRRRGARPLVPRLLSIGSSRARTATFSIKRKDLCPENRLRLCPFHSVAAVPTRNPLHLSTPFLLLPPCFSRIPNKYQEQPILILSFRAFLLSGYPPSSRVPSNNGSVSTAKGNLCSRNKTV